MAEFIQIINMQAASEPDALSAAMRCGADILALNFGAEAEAGEAVAAARAVGKALAAAGPEKKLAAILPLAVFESAAGFKPLDEIAKLNLMDLFCFSVSEKAGSAAVLESGRERISAFARQYEIALMLPCEEAAGFGLEKARAAGFRGIICQCDALLSDAGRESRAAALGIIGKIIREARRGGLKAGLIGGLQSPDIPRLSYAEPDYLEYIEMNNSGAENGRRGMVWRQTAGAGEGKTAGDAMRGGEKTDMADLETDKILVSDFIIPMNIGAYNHEKGAAQRVCFNVIAEIARLPHSMSDIFSYDIIIDAIARMAGQGHWEFVETIAEELAAFLLGFPRAARVTIRVEKLDLAPRAVGVEITREKP